METFDSYKERNRKILYNMLNHHTSPFTVLQRLCENGTSTFAIWLDKYDKRREPQTPSGMMRRLNVSLEWDFLLKDDRVAAYVENRALIIKIL